MSTEGATKNEFVVAEKAAAMAREIGIGGDVRARLSRMARRAAPITHPEGNRRFDDFVLRVNGKTVEAVCRYYQPE